MVGIGSMLGMARATARTPVSAPAAMLATFAEHLLRRGFMQGKRGPRAEAKALGLRTYISDVPCKRSHVGERTTSGGNCLKCQSEWFATNKDRTDAAKAKWLETNRH